jgi:hypothetical protein
MNPKISLNELRHELVRGKNYGTVAISLTAILWFALSACAGLPEGRVSAASEESCCKSEPQAEWIKIDTPTW